MSDTEFDTLDVVEQIEEKLEEVRGLIRLLRDNDVPEASDLKADLSTLDYRVGRLREGLAGQRRQSGDPAKRMKRRTSEL
jgi:hypothetical protein